ncbi:MAG: hypothetical protein WC683_04995 [bacterium]
MNGDSCVTVDQCDRRMKDLSDKSREDDQIIFGRLDTLEGKVEAYRKEIPKEAAAAVAAFCAKATQTTTAKTPVELIKDYRDTLLLLAVILLLGGEKAVVLLQAVT